MRSIHLGRELPFEVDNLEAAMVGQEILIPPNSPSDGVTVAMIVDQGAPIELIEFSQTAESVLQHLPALAVDHDRKVGGRKVGGRTVTRN